MNPNDRRKAGHYEILGETYAKLEFFEKGWNPYSRFLDIEKIDLVLRRVHQGRPIYRAVQVKYGKLYPASLIWEKKFFDCTSWRFFKANEFDRELESELFIAFVLAADTGYLGDIFIFPVRDMARLINDSIPSRENQRCFF